MQSITLDPPRLADRTYSRHMLLDSWIEGAAKAGFRLIATGPTWTSHGSFGPEGRQESTLDHIYTYGAEAKVKVREDSTNRSPTTGYHGSIVSPSAASAREDWA